jgi:hypothetical protein
MKKSSVLLEVVNNEFGRATRGMSPSGRSQIGRAQHPEVLGRAIRCAPHREAFIPDVKSLVSKPGWQGYNRTPTLGGHISRAPN